MAYRSMSVTQFTTKQKHVRKAQPLTLSQLPDGSDFLDIVDSALAQISSARITDDDKKSYAEVESWSREGRTIFVTVIVGTYGDTGSVREVATGVEAHAITPSQAHTVTLRCRFLVPPGGVTALMFVEHGQHRSAATALLKELKAYWLAQKPDFTLVTETVVQADAWLAQADLEGITVISYGHESDLADSGIPKTLGDLRSQIEPPKGQRAFPRAVKDALLNHNVNRAKLLGFREDDLDEVRVTLGDGTQSRTFVIDKDRTPAVRYLISEATDPTPDDTKFRQRVSTEALDLFSAVGGSWQTAWEQGSPTP
jgi:hypothetical protein